MSKQIMDELNREIVRLAKLLPSTDEGIEAVDLAEQAAANVTNERFKRDIIKYLMRKFPDHCLRSVNGASYE